MKKVIIIGAGPAGLTAAYELLKKSDEYDGPLAHSVCLERLRSRALTPQRHSILTA